MKVNKEKQILDVELYKDIVNENNDQRILLKEEQKQCSQVISELNDDISDLEFDMKILKGKIKANKRTLRKESRRLFKTNYSLNILNRKTNKLNKLFSRNKEEEIYKSNYVLKLKK